MPDKPRVLRFDSIPLDETCFTSEGYFQDTPIVTRVGIFEYTNPDGSVRRELRPPEEVFSPESLQSYEGKPIIVTHQAGLVDKDNVDQEIIGTMLAAGYQDGDNVRVKIIIHNTDVLKTCGLRELSLGYNLTLDETPGMWEGKPYDAVQRGMLTNHLALVANARAGDCARLNLDGQDTGKDHEKEGEKHMAGKRKKTRTDGMTPEELQAAIEAYKARKAERTAPPHTDAQEEETAVDGEEERQNTDAEDVVQTVKENRDRRDAEDDPENTEEAMGVIAQQDADIDSLLQLIATLMAQQDFDSAKACQGDNADNPQENEENAPSKTDGSEDKAGALNMDSADALIRQRLEVARLGDRLHLDGLENMPVMGAKKAIIQAVRPELRLDGKDTAYINAAFDIARAEALKRKDTNAQRRQMWNPATSRMDGGTQSQSFSARQKMLERQRGEK